VFNVPSCVLFAGKEENYPPRVRSYKLPSVEWSGNLPQKDVSWREAEQRLTTKNLTSRIIYLGERTALSSQKGRTSPNTPSPYAHGFHQGATILPRSFYFVTVRDLNDAVDPDRMYLAETDLKQAEEAKPPYDKAHLKGQVEGRFLFSTALSKHLLPFALQKPPTIVLPCDSNQEALTVLTADELRTKGYREFAKWMREAEVIWNTARKQKAESQTLYERLDYHGELTRQSLKATFLVLYNAAGTNLAATVIDRRSIALPFVVEHKLYWGAFGEDEEAYYVAGHLKSTVANSEIKPFQSQGLMGERDIEKKVLDLPFPLFDDRNSDHRRLVQLSKEAHELATSKIRIMKLPDSLAKRRGLVRQAVLGITREIDQVVSHLLK